VYSVAQVDDNSISCVYITVKALYSESHPEFLQYIYLVAPISLVFLNPIGFTMLEIHRRSQDSAPNRGTCRVLLLVLKDVISNPIVFMVLIGIAGNFVFQQKVPTVLDDILQVLGE